MNVSKHVLAGVLAAALAAIAGAQEIKLNLDPKKPAEPAKAPAAAPAAGGDVQFTDEQKLEAFGYYSALQLRWHELGFSESEARAIARGAALAASGREPAFDLGPVLPQVQELIGRRAQRAQERREQFLAQLRDKNTKLNADFLATLKGKSGVQESSSGLRYEIVAPGKSPKPKADQVARLHFTLKNVAGEVVDSTVARGEPVDVSIKDIIPGWAEGIQLLGVGGKAILYIPPELAFKDSGMGAIEPNAMLIFEIELLEVKDAPKEAAAK